MKQYQQLLTDILVNGGARQQNRTGIAAVSIPGAMMKFDLQKGFPAITTKKLAFKSMIGELICFLQDKTSAADFRAMGCNFWDQNANENKAWLESPNREGVDDLGRIYGKQWRDWAGYEYDGGGMYRRYRIDQVLEALDTIRNNPTNRRIIINAWRPDEFDQMALPPCHVLYQFIVNVERQELNLCMYQRSCDMFLGVPMNIASAAALLTIFARLTGLTPRWFTHFLADAHIYTNHMDQVHTLLKREPLPLPHLELQLPGMGVMSDAQILEALRPEHFNLIGYESHAAIAAPMAV